MAKNIISDSDCIPIGPFPMGCHTELISEKDIEFILSQYNFFNLEWKNDAETTRLQVPETLRRNGLWITYSHNGERVTERFIGTDMDAQIPETWKDSRFWENLDFEQILAGVENAFLKILNNLDKNPKFKDFLAKLLSDLIGKRLSPDDLKELIKLYLKQILEEKIPSGYLDSILINIINSKLDDYINSAGFKNTLKSVLKELLRETIDDLDCVLGPDRAVDGNIVIFDGNSGKLIADSCINIDSLRWLVDNIENIKYIIEHGCLWETDGTWLWPKQSNKNIWVSNINAEGKIIQQGSGQYPNNSPSYIQD